MAISHVDLAAALDASSSQPLAAALEAYTFAYPLVIMDATGRVATSVSRADCELGSGAPGNQFSHLRHLLGIEFGGVSRPNLDTLYSSLWFDVSEEPLIISVPDSNGRFYALSLLDLWSDVFASLGARTTGTGAQSFAIVAPSWRGELPRGMRAYPSPTARGWLLGLAEVHGLAGIPEVARFQSGMQAVPWSVWRSGQALSAMPAVRGSVPEDPLAYVSGMTPSDFFSRFCELASENPPHAQDAAMVGRLRRIGIDPGKPFVPQNVPRAVRSVLELAKDLLPQRLEAAYPQCFRSSNQWRARLGLREADYLRRASTAHAGIGVNASADAVDFTSAREASGSRLRSSTPYTLSFRPGQLPPARAFWSLTLYDERQRLAANAISRYTLCSKDDLLLEPDGSLNIYIQRDAPGGERERNWLPAPASGTFSLSLRLYWPERVVAAGEWAPPPVQYGAALPAPSKLWFARDRFEWTEEA